MAKRGRQQLVGRVGRVRDAEPVQKVAGITWKFWNSKFLGLGMSW